MKNSEDESRGQSEPSGISPEEQIPVTGFRRWFWIAVAAGSLFWVFFPEATDVIPVIGWLDEGVALLLFFKALSKLGVHFPFLERVLRGLPGRGGTRRK